MRRKPKSNSSSPAYVCLAWAVLPLALGNRHREAVVTIVGVVFFNSSQVHIEAAFDHATS